MRISHPCAEMTAADVLPIQLDERRVATWTEPAQQLVTLGRCDAEVANVEQHLPTRIRRRAHASICEIAVEHAPPGAGAPQEASAYPSVMKTPTTETTTTSAAAAKTSHAKVVEEDEVGIGA